MLHPSYTDLMKVVNKDVEPGEEPVVSSRSICKLARVIECDTSLCCVRDDETHLWLLSQSHESLGPRNKNDRK